MRDLVKGCETLDPGPEVAGGHEELGDLEELQPLLLVLHYIEATLGHPSCCRWKSWRGLNNAPLSYRLDRQNPLINCSSQSLVCGG